MTMKPVLVQITGKESGDRWLLTGEWDGRTNHTGPWLYRFRVDGVSYRLTVPFMFDKLDGASVPRLVDTVVRMGGRDIPDEAWIPHDFFYNCKGKIPGLALLKFDGGAWIPVNKISKAFADKVFYNELKSAVHGMASFKPFTAYLGVKVAFWKRF